MAVDSFVFSKMLERDVALSPPPETISICNIPPSISDHQRVTRSRTIGRLVECSVRESNRSPRYATAVPSNSILIPIPCRISNISPEIHNEIMSRVLDSNS
ncbi:Uncharacterised protein r2_g3587 [Pycnogonum litorale]